MRHFGLLLTFFLISFLCHAQLEIGIQAGYGFPSFLVGSSDQPGTTTFSNVHDNIILSFGIRQRTKKVFNLGLNLAYQNQSFKLKSSVGGLGSWTSHDLKINYGNVRLDILPEFVIGENLKVVISPGFTFGTLLHSHCTGSDAFGLNEPPYTQTVNNVNGSARAYFSRLDFGVLFQLGLDIPLSKRIVLEIDNTEYLYIFGGPSISEVKIHYIHVTFTGGVFYKL
jgi:hypothetical protein